MVFRFEWSEFADSIEYASSLFTSMAGFMSAMVGTMAAAKIGLVPCVRPRRAIGVFLPHQIIMAA
jgi:hypothetical protein